MKFSTQIVAAKSRQKVSITTHSTLKQSGDKLKIRSNHLACICIFKLAAEVHSYAWIFQYILIDLRPPSGECKNCTKRIFFPTKVINALCILKISTPHKETWKDVNIFIKSCLCDKHDQAESLSAAPFLWIFLYLLLLYHTLTSSSLCTTTALKHKGKQKKQNMNFNKSLRCSLKDCFVILPSDGFDLADKVRKFAVSCVRQQHTEKRSHDASCTKNKKWQNLHVHTCKQSRTCIIYTNWESCIFPVQLTTSCSGCHETTFTKNIPFVDTV